MDGSGQAHQGLYITRKKEALLERTETGSGRCFGYPLPQSEADELVPAGLEEVLDVFFPAQTHTSGSQISCKWFGLGYAGLRFGAFYPSLTGN